MANPSRLKGMTMKTRSTSCAESLVATVGFDLLGERLGGDLERAVEAGLAAGAVFPSRLVLS